jgi:hypothetical protein
MRTNEYYSRAYGGKSDCVHNWKPGYEQGFDIGLTDDDEPWTEDQYQELCVICNAERFRCVQKITTDDFFMFDNFEV